MYKSEKRTILYVLGLYLSSTLLLIVTLFSSYYFYKHEQLIHNEKEVLKSYSLELEEKLAQLHNNSEKRYLYPRLDRYNSAIFDIDKKLIFSTIENKLDTLDEEFFFIKDNSYYLSSLRPYYLGAAYTLIEKKTQSLNLLSEILQLAFIVMLITIVTSIFLVKLVLKPIRDNLHMLDNFIKETTHELNTPLTTILANIETLDETECNEKVIKKLHRIKIASHSISNLYQDLVYLFLNHETASQDEQLDLSQIIHDRARYFEQMASTKKVSIELFVHNDVSFFADKQKMQRLIDNLLSNAIKYTRVNTKVSIYLTQKSLCIKDQGKGMSEQELSNVYKKYIRFDKEQEGFGIGYSIIKSIIDKYEIKLSIYSKVNIGTEVMLEW